MIYFVVNYYFRARISVRVIFLFIEENVGYVKINLIP